MKVLNTMVDIVSAAEVSEERYICVPGQVLRAVDFDRSLDVYAEVLAYTHITEDIQGINHVYLADKVSGKNVAMPRQQVLNSFDGSSPVGGFWAAGMLRIPVQGMYGTLYNRQRQIMYVKPCSVMPIAGQSMLKADGRAVPMARYVGGAGLVPAASLAQSKVGPKFYCRYSDRVAEYFGLSHNAAVRLTDPFSGRGAEEFLPLPLPALLSSWEEAVWPLLGIDGNVNQTVLNGYGDLVYHAMCHFMADAEVPELFIGHKFNPVVTGLDTARPYTVAEYRSLNNVDMLAACANGSNASLRLKAVSEFNPDNPFAAIDTAGVQALANIMRTGSVKECANMSGTL